MTVWEGLRNRQPARRDALQHLDEESRLRLADALLQHITGPKY
ncbi:hypothetical protein [Inquilinus limosus]